ncbi:phosphoglucosamine mutase [Henriciella sp.]|uniref:phosphoglucosamine mutase n=1 Tax=Henriciella sp. TaxID=1968823 RepID=UPI002639382E|nr:phosphoglucosamine mutase [Henriciella sp.]
MSRKYFGTDGIRGTANTPPMTPEIAMRLGMAAGKYFRRDESRRHSVVIGKDTRLSGYMIEPALVAGFTSVGMDVTLFGPLPTPGVAMMTPSLRADLGVMISASHNAFEDNGLKLFGPDGYKLSDAIELEIESRMDRALDDKLAPPDALGRTQRVDDAQARYVEIVKATFPRGMRLSGLRVCVDCANGAAYRVAPKALYELGAEVIPIGVNPDGFNINREVGSTDTLNLRQAVLKYRADIGIALDGDADRCILIDEQGETIDGDQLIALIATHWKERGLLSKDGVVTTVMSNLGLEQYLEKIGLSLDRTKVGDRYVVEKMREGGFNLGGEQSGHIVLSDYTTTGDGLIAALQALAVMVISGKPLSKVSRVFKPVPQKLINVRYTSGAPLENTKVRETIEAVEKRLGSSGRLVIRKSGTEPLIRVMAEAENPGEMEKAATEIADAVRAAG